MIRFAVVTKTSPQDMALGMDVYVEKEQPRPENNFTAKNVNIAELIGPQVMALRTPVFYLGEIILLNEDGREVDGPQRKPDKWYVEIDVYTDLNEAIARSREVRE